MQFRKFAGRAALALCAVAATVAFADTKIACDPALPSYQKIAEPLAGNLNSVGSDTMNNLMTYWAEDFKKLYPDVAVQVEGKGSGTAPTALVEGTAQFGPMSRDMKASEIDAFEKKFGYKPTKLKTSMDALAVFVHRDNPVKSLSMTQVDSIFSSTRKRGGKDALTWGDVGVGGEWADKPINIYGRNSASGTYSFFKEHALKNGDYRNTVKEQPGSASVVQGVSEDPFAIGYSGIGYATSGVRAVPLGEKDGGQAFPADYQNVQDGTYPLWRYLIVYVNKAPNKPLSPLVREFGRFIFSKEGQQVVIKDNYLPLDEKTAAAERKLLD